MTEKGQDAVIGNRIYWLDNLRTFMIFLVVLLHAGIVYESSGVGALFWIVDDPSTNNLSGILNLILDIMVMSTIFFVSGFFMPLSMKNKKGWAFLKSRFKRLIVPWIIAVLTLIPLYKIIFLYSRNLPQESWTTYFHWSNGIFSQNWLWFLPVLFLFDILYLFFSRVKINISNITLKKAVWAVFLFGFIYLVCMDIFNGEGWTKTILIDFQNERLLIYFMVFLLGSLSNKLKIFESKGKNKRLYIVLSCTAWIPVILYIKLLLYSMINPGKYIFSEIVDALLIRLNLLLSLLCLLYLMINTFRYYLNKQGKISKVLNKNSYNVYIIHVIVMGGIALTMLNRAIPSLIKYLVLTVSTYASCNLIVYFYRKVIKSKILIKITEEKAMKTVMTAMLVVTLLTVAGCGKQENPTPHVSLHVAALQGSIDEIQKHIKAGSDLNEKDEYGSSPLIIAVTFGKNEVARALIEAGADMKITNNEGSTPLHIAAFLCRTEIVEALLDNGADKNLRNNSGATALEAVSRPFEDVKGIYDSIRKALRPLGLKLDYERIKMTRPKIAEMLR
jgi:hypothetical protein